MFVNSYSQQQKIGILRGYQRNLVRNPAAGEVAIKPYLMRTCPGVRFQYIVPGIARLGYIVDFALPSKWIAIEIDGSYHLTPDQITADLKRSEHLNLLGWRVLRVMDAACIQNPSFAADAVADAVRSLKYMNANPVYDGIVRLFAHQIHMPGPFCRQEDRPIRKLEQGRPR